ncbi:MAG TPA: hypothetical protein EYN88_01415 [Candidatus Poseidoniales archaeon]|nr:hypothetical protein [Candidatus Poseidoniales archaeon]
MSRKTNSNRTFSAFVLVALMFFSTTVAAVSITTFGNGESSISIEIRDTMTYANTVDGVVDLPAGETVTSASMKVSTTITTHQQHVRFDSSTTPWIWDPSINNQQTAYSIQTDFTYTEPSLRLISNGYSTDFEQTDGGFGPDFMHPYGNWEHGSLTTGEIIPADCSSGNECWGTTLFDDDYTDDRTSPNFEISMESASTEVKTGGFIARFSSWHGLFYNESISGSVTDTRYYDCGYVELMNSSNGQDWGGIWIQTPFDIGNSTLGYNNGLKQKGAGNGKIQFCDGIGLGQYALAGESTDSILNPTGWGTLALNLEEYVGKYVKIRFVLERNNHVGVAVNSTMPGWYIDDFRLGDPLPQSGYVDVKNFAPSIFPDPGFPDGYGILLLESETTATNTLSVDVIHSSSGNVVIDTNGNALTGLEGPIIELWNINSTQYPLVNFRFTFDSGIKRLASPVLHGLSLGTRLGSGFNDSSTVIAGAIRDGIWESPGMDIQLMYQPRILDAEYNPPIIKSRLEYPITRIKPIVTDSCAEAAKIGLVYPGLTNFINLTNQQWYTLAQPIFTFTGMLSYSGPCSVSGMWFDVEFSFNPLGVYIDVAGDGDSEWGFDEPAFGNFGRQTNFWTGKVDGINLGSDTSNLSIGASGIGDGGWFMVPLDADIIAANFAFDSNTISSTSDASEGFSLNLVATGQMASLGDFENTTVWIPEAAAEYIDFAAAVQSLLDNPMVAVSYTDAYANDWVTMYFEATSPNATTGSSLRFLDLNILYYWEKTLGNSHGLVREFSQGVALGSDNNGLVSVPIHVQAASGGGVALSELMVVTSPGYDSSLSITGEVTGLYPDGSIIEVISLHYVDGGTGTTLDKCLLRLESATGSVDLSYDDFNGFSEVNDPDNLISLQPSVATDTAQGKQVSWRFTVNTNWEDAPDVRIFASLLAANGVEGLPSALHLAPAGGNAIENDAGIATFDLQNSAGESQNPDDARSNQLIRLTGSVRLENLDVSPDPSAYNLLVEEEVQNNTIPDDITYDWVEIDNITGPIGGDFDWMVDLGFDAAGEGKYRLRMSGYDKGTNLDLNGQPCFSNETCAISFNLTIDTLEPGLVNISVFQNQIYWRVLEDNTWVIPSVNQQFKVEAWDSPTPPASLTFNYWVEYDHDINGDREAQESEYNQITIVPDGAAPTGNYTTLIKDDITGTLSINDVANEGLNPYGLVSIYISGTDIAGNQISGGAAGFDNDSITYISMDSYGPTLQNFFIYDSSGTSLNSMRKTMYAGNTYDLVVEGTDPNGWSDVDYIEVDLNPGVQNHMKMIYHFNNNTVVTTSQWLNVIPASNTSEGTVLTNMSGYRLIDRFEPSFRLVIPIELAWNAYEATGVMTPQVRISDKDANNPSSILSPGGGRTLQKWNYGDGITLDTFSMKLTDSVAPFTEEIYNFSTGNAIGFVYKRDVVSFTGRYAFVDSLGSGIVSPETELTMEIIREEGVTVGNYEFEYGETTYHNFTAGSFNISLVVPSATNEFTYTFTLINLPQGAVDSTTIGEAKFVIKVDSSPPEVMANTWSVTSAGGELLDIGVLPSSSIHCVDVQLMISESEQLDQGAITVFWNYFQIGNMWSFYTMEFGMDNLSAPLDFIASGNLFIATATCIDLWPGSELPGKAQIPDPPSASVVSLQFWVAGTDSAGLGIQGGGEFGSPIIGTERSSISSYSVVYEQAEFHIGPTDVTMFPESPSVGEDIRLDIRMTNVGNVPGNITLDIYSNVGGQTTQLVKQITTDAIAVSETKTETVTIEAFARATTGVHFEIYDNASGEMLWSGKTSGKQFSVKVGVSSGSDDGMLMLILTGLGGLILILVVIVGVLVVRNKDEEGEQVYDEYLDDEVSPKTYPSTENAMFGPDAGSVPPMMQEALAEFAFWDQQQIQGYFDQGWSLEQLRDWVNENN